MDNQFCKRINGIYRENQALVTIDSTLVWELGKNQDYHSKSIKEKHWMLVVGLVQSYQVPGTKPDNSLRTHLCSQLLYKNLYWSLFLLVGADAFHKSASIFYFGKAYPPFYGKVKVDGPPFRADAIHTCPKNNYESKEMLLTFTNKKVKIKIVDLIIYPLIVSKWSTIFQWKMW